MKSYILPFKKINHTHLPEVGGKNASLGEMFNNLKPLGVEVPDGFAITVESYRSFLSHNKLTERLRELLNTIDNQSLSNLPEIALQCRTLMSDAVLPDEVKKEITQAYNQLSGVQSTVSVAVRSSATAEDLPTASFAGQHDSFLNIRGEGNLLAAVHKCYISLFNDRAVKYRIDNDFDHMQVGLSVGVQYMVRSDKGCAGVTFTLDPESGFKNAIYITGTWGLGENVVQGAVNPDEFWVFKPTLQQGKNAIIGRNKGEKEHTMIYDDSAEAEKPVKNIETPSDKRMAWILSDSEVSELARWSYEIEKHYALAMDIEWAKDGIDNKIYIVQARPETVHSQKDHGKIDSYVLKEKGKVLCKGKAVGKKIISGRATVIQSLNEAGKLQEGDILIADNTNPDWNSLPGQPQLIPMVFPETCAVLDRRSSERVETPLGANFMASLEIHGNPHEWSIYDFSLGGIGLRCSKIEAKGLLKGRKLPDVHLELEEETIIVAELEVRFTRAFRSFLLGEQIHIGCMFVNLTPEAESEIKKLLDQINNTPGQR